MHQNLTAALLFWSLEERESGRKSKAEHNKTYKICIMWVSFYKHKWSVLMSVEGSEGQSKIHIMLFGRYDR
jgi:hypothetical protein